MKIPSEIRDIANRLYQGKTDEELLSSLKGGAVCDDNAIYFLLLDNYSPKLRSFDGRSSFGTWYGRVAYYKFNELKRHFINKHIVELDRFDAVGSGPEDIEKRLQRIMLTEAISRLREQDDKFIIIRRLYGYSSKEIAVMLQCRWDKHGIIKRDRLFS